MSGDEQRDKPRVFRFGVFEADLAAGELRRQGTLVKLQDQPFRLLALLLECPGAVVTREELRTALWPDGRFVDFEYGVNTAIKKVRDALGDSAENPCFIETLPRKGYRFIAPVSAAAPPPTVPARGPDTESAPRRLRLWALALLVLAGIVAATFWSLSKRTVVEAVSPVPLTSYPGMELEPAFSPDGSSVAFSWQADKEDASHIYTKPLGADKPVQLTDGPVNDCSPAWSPDGRLIAFYRYHSGSKSEVFVIPAAAGPATKVAEAYVVISSQPRPFLTWTSDGASLVISDAEGSGPVASAPSEPASGGGHPAGLFLLSYSTGRRRKLTFPPSGSIGDGAPAFSPDGHSLAFARSTSLGVGEIYVLPLSPELAPAAEPRRLTSGGHFATSPAWTMDGREILFATGQLGGPDLVQSSLWRIAANGGSAPRRLEFAGDSAFFPAVSHRAHLAYAQGTRDVNIWKIDLASSANSVLPPTRLIASTRDDAVPRFSPDGKRVVFISDRGGSPQVWIVNADGSSPLQLTSMNASVTGSPGWAPDGSRVVFDSNKGGRFQVYSVSAAGGAPQPLTDTNADNAVASYSRDGRWIYFASNRTGNFQIWKMPAGGGTAVPVTKNGGRVAVESLDGKFVYYATTILDGKPNSLWRVPVAGGEETPVISSVIPFNFAVAREGIYFTAQANADQLHTIEFFSFTTGRSTPVLSATGATGSGISVSPDGRSLLYAQYDQKGADLMLIEKFR